MCEKVGKIRVCGIIRAQSMRCLSLSHTHTRRLFVVNLHQLIPIGLHKTYNLQNVALEPNDMP
jgi:ribosomal protein L28